MTFTNLTTYPLVSPPTNTEGNRSLVLSPSVGLEVEMASGTGTSAVFLPGETVLTSASGLKTIVNFPDAITKTISGTWVAGNTQPGLDTGTALATGSYYYWRIYNPTTKARDALISNTLTPVLPTGFTFYRLVSASYRSSGSFNIYKQSGKDFVLSKLLVYSVTVAAQEGLVTLPIPTGFICGVSIYVSPGEHSSNEQKMYIDVNHGLFNSAMGLTSNNGSPRAGWSRVDATGYNRGNLSEPDIRDSTQVCKRVLSNDLGQIYIRKSGIATTLGPGLASTVHMYAYDIPSL